MSLHSGAEYPRAAHIAASKQVPDRAPNAQRLFASCTSAVVQDALTAFARDAALVELSGITSPHGDQPRLQLPPPSAAVFVPSAPPGCRGGRTGSPRLWCIPLCGGTRTGCTCQDCGLLTLGHTPPKFLLGSPLWRVPPQIWQLQHVFRHLSLVAPTPAASCYARSHLGWCQHHLPWSPSSPPGVPLELPPALLQSLHVAHHHCKL